MTRKMTDLLDPATLRPVELALKAAADSVMKSGLNSRSTNNALLVIFQQLHEMNRETLEKAKKSEEQANLAKLAAMKAFEETKVRLELVREALGMPRVAEGPTGGITNTKYGKDEDLLNDLYKDEHEEGKFSA